MHILEPCYCSIKHYHFWHFSWVLPSSIMRLWGWRWIRMICHVIRAILPAFLTVASELFSLHHSRKNLHRICILCSWEAERVIVLWCQVTCMTCVVNVQNVSMPCALCMCECNMAISRLRQLTWRVHQSQIRCNIPLQVTLVILYKSTYTFCV